jgi:hypothetical protein
MVNRIKSNMWHAASDGIYLLMIKSPLSKVIYDIATKKQEII